MSFCDVSSPSASQPQLVAHPGDVRARPRAVLDFASLYEAWFDEVACWLRALGAPPADHEDLAQEVFLVVRRRLPDFDGRNLRAWLYQIARRQVLRHRRLVWVRRVFMLSPSEVEPELPHVGDSPLAALESKEQARVLDHLLSRLTEKRRVVFVLFEIEGRSGEEIAELLDVPLNAVWTRLHRARQDFFAHAARYRRSHGGDR